MRSVNSSIRRRVMVGASSASPAAIIRTAAVNWAAGVSLSRNPLAPALNASKTYSSRSKVVRMSTFGVLAWPDGGQRRVAAMPSRSGMRMSISTTSGCCS